MWKQKLLVFLITLIFFFYGSYNLKNATYLYLVKLNISPVQKTESQQVSRLSGLASLAGLSLGSSSSNSLALYRELLSSRSVAERLSTKKELYEKVFDKDWNNPKLHKKKQNISPTNVKTYIRYMLGIPLFDRSLNVVEEYHKLLKSDIEVAPISDSGIFSISFYSSDPKVGIELLQNLAMITDNLIKDRAKKRSESNVKYLNSKLKTIANKEQRASLITTLAQEQKNIMATSTPLPYVAERFEKPFSSPGPMKPNVTLSLILYIFIGGVTGSLLAIVYELRFRKKKI